MRRLHFNHALVLASAAIAAITTIMPRGASAQQWRVQETARIGVTGVRSAPFTGIAGIVVRDSGFFVLEKRSARLFGYDAAGTPRWSTPEGPVNGKPMALLGLSNGELVLPDSQSNNYIVYDSTGALLRRVLNPRGPEFGRGWSRIGARPVQYVGWIYGVRERIRTRPEAGYEGADVLAVAWPDGSDNVVARSAVDPPVELDDNERMVFNGKRNEVLFAGTDDRLFIATSAAYRIDAYRDDGSLVNTLSRNVPRAASTAKDRISARRDLAVMHDSMGADKNRFVPVYVLPDSADVITAIVAGDSIVLARRNSRAPGEPATTPGMTRWDVLSFDTGYIGWFELNARARILAVRNGRLYSALTAPGGELVMVSALKRPPK